MIVKTPFVVSTSQYNSPEVRWTESEIPVAAVLGRASIGTPGWMGSEKRAADQVFPNYWRQWELMRVPRSAYHFLKTGVSAADQARWFVQCVNKAGGWKPGDKLCLDVEEEVGLSVQMLVDWFYNVQQLVPGTVPHVDFLNYSRADILNALNLKKLTQAQRDYLRSIPTWIAGYPDEPDEFNFEQLAAAYHADTSKWGPCVIVQYAASAMVQGISKPDYLSVECNVAAPWYLVAWQQATNNNPVPEQPGDQPNGGEPMPTIYYGKVRTTLNIRSGPSAVSADIGNLYKGDKVEAAAKDPDGVWWKLSKINGVAVATESWAHGDYIEPTGQTTQPDPETPPASGEDYIIHHRPDGSTKRYNAE